MNFERKDKVVRAYLAETATGSSLDFLIVDWDDRFQIFASEETSFDDKSIELLSLGRVVVSDRLEGAILAYISGLPFIFLDQASHSPGHGLSVALDTPNCGDRALGVWSLATTLQDAVVHAASMLNSNAIP